MNISFLSYTPPINAQKIINRMIKKEEIKTLIN